MFTDETVEALKAVINVIPQEDWVVDEKHVVVKTRFGTPVADVPNLNIAKYLVAIQPKVIREALKVQERKTKRRDLRPIVVKTPSGLYLSGYSDGWLEWSPDIEQAVKFLDQESALKMTRHYADQCSYIRKPDGRKRK